MPSHPNRSKQTRKAGANPSREEVRAARHAIGASQKEAAALVYAGERTWQQWEAGDRKCHPATWELFQIKSVRIQDVALAGVTCRHAPIMPGECDDCRAALDAALDEQLELTRDPSVDYRGRFRR